MAEHFRQRLMVSGILSGVSLFFEFGDLISFYGYHFGMNHGIVHPVLHLSYYQRKGISMLSPEFVLQL